MNIEIVPAREADFEATARIETAADQLLIDAFQPTDWPPAATAEERASSPGYTLVALVDGEAVGFVQVLELEGQAHLEQLSVLPAWGGRGIGRSLLEAGVAEAARLGYGEITLRTFADVAFNAPFYATCGFEVSEPSTALERGLVAVEERLGLMELGRRVQMTRPLGA